MRSTSSRTLTIAFDGKADDVFEALIKKKYRAIPFWDPLLIAAWRHYVIGDGPLPRRPASPADTRPGTTKRVVGIA